MAGELTYRQLYNRLRELHLCAPEKLDVPVAFIPVEGGDQARPVRAVQYADHSIEEAFGVKAGSLFLSEV